MSSYGRGDTFSLESCVDFTDPNVLDRIDAWGLDDLLGPDALNRDMARRVRYDNDAKKGICARHLKFERCTSDCRFAFHLLGRQALGSRADPSSEINGRLTRCLCGAPLQGMGQGYCSLQGACLLAAPALLEIHNAPPRSPPLPTVAFALGAGPDLQTDVATRNALLDAAASVTGRDRPVVTDVVLERCRYHERCKTCPNRTNCRRLHVLGRGSCLWSSKSSGELCYCGAESKRRSGLYFCTEVASCPLHTKWMLLIAQHGTNLRIWFPPGSAADLSDTAVRQPYLDEVALLKRLLAANPTGTRLLAAHHAASTAATTAPTSMDAAPSLSASTGAPAYQGGGHASLAATLGFGDGASAFAATVPTDPAVAPSPFVAPHQQTSSAPVVDAPFAPRPADAFAAAEPPSPPPRGHHSEAVELDALRDLTTKMKVSPPRMRTADRAAGLAQFEDEPRPGTADTADTAPVAPKRELEFSSPKRNKAKASIGAADGSRKPQFKKSPTK